MLCKKCGVEFEGNFCPACGGKAEEVSLETGAVVMEAGDLPEAPVGKKSFLKNKWVILAAGAVVVLVAVIALVLPALFKLTPKKVDRMIEAIGTVTLESEEKIAKAEESLASLEEGDQAEVENKQILTDARANFDKIKAAYDAIEKIGEVSANEESGSLITTARNAYNECGEDFQEQVTNFKKLEEAEAKYGALKVEIAEGLIEKIGKVTLKSKDAIKKARETYDELSSEQKAAVKNSNTLVSAESALKKLQQKEAQKYLKQLKKEKDEVTNIVWYRPSTTPKYINTRNYVLPYIGVQNSSVWLRVVMNYTGDDWIFWKKATFSIDGKNQYKFFSYYDIERDNEYGDVWEYVDIAATDSDIELLKAIANSKKTIVRFEGDNHYDDWTISEKDKTAIKQVLKAYEALNG